MTYKLIMRDNLCRAMMTRDIKAHHRHHASHRRASAHRHHPGMKHHRA
jgi:hypothetical protein